MTKAEALQAFFERFLDRVYEASTVPDGTGGKPPPEYPYLTYGLVDGDWNTGAMALEADLWYRSMTLDAINAKTDEIGTALGLGGLVLSCGGGALWIRKGAPFAQAMSDPGDAMVKRKYINLTVEFFTQ